MKHSFQDCCCQQQLSWQMYCDTKFMKVIKYFLLISEQNHLLFFQERNINQCVKYPVNYSSSVTFIIKCYYLFAKHIVIINQDSLTQARWTSGFWSVPQNPDVLLTSSKRNDNEWTCNLGPFDSLAIKCN